MIMINQYLGRTVLPKKGIVLLQKMPKMQTFHDGFPQPDKGLRRSWMDEESR